MSWNEANAHNSLYFQSKQNLTISGKNSCILNMQRGITRRTQINWSWMDITTSLVLVLQSMKTGNDGTGCIEKQSACSIPPSHTSLWFTSYTVNQKAAHHQSEHSMAQMSDSPPPRLHMLNRSRQRPRGSESFRSRWTHRTYLFPTSPEYFERDFFPQK